MTSSTFFDILFYILKPSSTRNIWSYFEGNTILRSDFMAIFVFWTFSDGFDNDVIIRSRDQKSDFFLPKMWQIKFGSFHKKNIIN